QYVSAGATGNPDLRSLYADPAVPWPYVQYQVETLSAPPSSAGIAAADFQFVQKQTLAELAALQTVNQLYGVTGQILTNTYLVKDAALSEVTSALGLSSDPNVAGTVVNALTTALGNLGSALSAATSIIQITKSATELAKLANSLNAAGSLSYLLGSITGDISTYTASSADLSSGSYSLKTTLDNDALAAVTANSCHQLSALSDWNESKFIADGILTGTLPLDLETQQAVLVASQALFRLNVWQTLAPSKWSYLSVSKTPLIPPPCNNCLFTGNSNYPLAYSVQVSASCNTGNQKVSLILEDPNTHNYPNLTAMNALFSGPPTGLGADVNDVLLGNNGWSIPYQGNDPNFFLNTGYTTPTCSNFQVLNPQLTPNVRGGPGTSSQDSAANLRLERLIADVKTTLTDVRVRDTLVMLLDVANRRLEQASRFEQEPRETLRLLNEFITRAQWHADQNFRDSETVRAESIEAVAIRDSLINSFATASLRENIAPNLGVAHGR
ncbi:MAG: hypothetical protein JO022_16430, partial [Acidobacteriaceae bacterium]|nr:hypothetical protein [Acidobacteriaceae bacterium]